MTTDEIMRIVTARCEDALGVAELAMIEAALKGGLDAMVCDRVIAAIDALERRFADMIERTEAERRVAEAARVFIDEASDAAVRWQ